MALLFRNAVLASARKLNHQPLSRSFKTGAKFNNPVVKKSLAVGAATATTIGTTLLVGKSFSQEESPLSKLSSVLSDLSANFSVFLFGSVTAAQKKKNGSHAPCGGSKKKKSSCVEPQKNILSCPTPHTLFLWITLDSSADQCKVARVAADIECLIAAVDDGGCDEIVAGVGFGPSFYSQVMGKTSKNFYYNGRKCAAGELPCACGDILLHVKASDRGKLFEICKNYLYSFPEGSIREYEDVYGYEYKCNKDLSDFCINTSNRQDEEGIKEVSVDCETGGSYALAMKWVHDFSVIRPENKDALEKFIGRTQDGVELKNKTESAHISRMRGTCEYEACPCFEATMQCQSYGTLAKGAGLFVLGFVNDPTNFEFMLDQMVGSSCDGCTDDLFKFTKNVKGKYFYFPGLDDLECMRHVGK